MGSYSAEMFRIGEILIFVLFIRSIFLTHCDIEESCPKINTNQTCQFAELGKPSIEVRSTAGRLGNALFSYIILLGFKIQYGVQVYMPESKRSLLTTYFDNLEIQSAEENVCNFEQDYKRFFDDLRELKMQRILDHIRKKANNPNLKFRRNEEGKIIVPRSYYDDPYYEIDRIVHQDSFSTLPENLSMPEPWLITQTGDVQEIENRKLLEGHVILDYSDTVTNFTKTISIPGIGDRLEDNLRFKKKYLTK